MQPVISVIIPAYNAETFLAEAVESVLRQTRPADEILVIDDGSTDRTDTIARTFASRIRYIRQKNAGVMATRNHGVLAAHGDWIAFLDADDFWFPYKLEIQLKALQSVADDVLLCSDAIPFENTAPSPPPPQEPRTVQISAARMIKANLVATSTVLLPRKSILAIGGFSKEYNHAEDWAVWLRLLAQGLPIWNISQSLAGIRFVSSSLGGRPPRLLRDIEVKIIQDFISKSPFSVSRALRQEALAGAYLRSAISCNKRSEHFEGLIELLRSACAWPFRIVEYTSIYRFIRTQLLLTMLRDAILRTRSSEPTSHFPSSQT